MESYAVTISPCPLWVVQWPRPGTPKMIYRHCTVKDQYRHMALLLKQCYESVTERWDEEPSMKFYFEMNKRGHLHAHGIVTCTEHQMEYIKDWIYDECGRSGRSPILQKACIDVQTLEQNNQYRALNGLPSWEHYIVKEQTHNWRNHYAEIFHGKNL